MEDRLKNILEQLPYREPFRFVDELESVGPEGISGYYTFRAGSWYYAGHFPDNPVTPGVLLTECCAQIGLVCLGMHLVAPESPARNAGNTGFAMTDSDMEFLRPVFPGARVKVISELVYFRFGKLRCKVRLYGGDGSLACKGRISGMLNTTGP